MYHTSTVVGHSHFPRLFPTFHQIFCFSTSPNQSNFLTFPVSLTWTLYYTSHDYFKLYQILHQPPNRHLKFQANLTRITKATSTELTVTAPFQMCTKYGRQCTCISDSHHAAIHVEAVLLWPDVKLQYAIVFDINTDQEKSSADADKPTRRV